MQQTRALVMCAVALVGLTGCAADTADDPADETGNEVRQIVLGPVDGHDLSPTDLERVTAGDLAPNFTAMSLDGDAVTLSDFRGEKNVVLFFYRGHW